MRDSDISFLFELLICKHFTLTVCTSQNQSKRFKLKLLIHSDSAASRFRPPIEDWRIVYSPKNDILEQVVRHATQSLGPVLQGFMGVSDANAVAAAMVNNHMVAGIDFNHSAVNESHQVESK